MCGDLHSDLRTLHAVHAAMGHLKGAYDCLHVDVERVRGPQGVLFHQAVAFHSLLVTQRAQRSKKNRDFDRE